MKLRANEEVQRFKVVNFIFHLFVVTVMVRDCTQAHLCGGFRGRGRFFPPYFYTLPDTVKSFSNLLLKPGMNTCLGRQGLEIDPIILEIISMAWQLQHHPLSMSAKS